MLCHRTVAHYGPRFLLFRWSSVVSHSGFRIAFTGLTAGHPVVMSTHPDSESSANDDGGVGDTLRPMEATDADDVRNHDGDDTVDPPERWSGADKITADGEVDETLDDKLAAEEPDVIYPAVE